MLQLTSEQIWNDSVPVSPASGSENVADSWGTASTRAAIEPSAGTSGNAFAAGCVIWLTPS